MDGRPPPAMTDGAGFQTDPLPLVPRRRRTSISTLTHIAATGAILWTVPFPEHFANIPDATSGGTTRAAPNIWRNGSQAAIIVPAVYKVLGGGSELHLLTFSPNGGPPREQSVTYQGQTISGGSDLLGAIGCYVTLCFLPQLPPDAGSAQSERPASQTPACSPAGSGDILSCRESGFSPSPGAACLG